MTWEQKLAALNALTEHRLMMRRPGDWYVSANIEIAGDGVLVGAFGNGATPEAAVSDHWSCLVDNLFPDQYLLARGGRDKAVRWNGFMWEDMTHMRHKVSRGVSRGEPEEAIQSQPLTD